MNSEEFSPSENESPQTESVPLPPTETPAAPSSETSGAPDTLGALTTLSQSGRMSPASETRASELLRQALLGGRVEIDEALEAIAILPWPVSVNGLNAAWPEIKPYGRRLFVSGMKSGKFEGEAGRRIRLSLTRGLVKIDETQAAKWACAIAAEMLGEEGVLSQRDRQSFFNVFIGKGRPWLAHLPLAGLKETDVRAFLSCAVITVFGGGCPPFTQSALLLWMLTAGRIEALDEKSIQTIAASLQRWPGRLLRDLVKHQDALPAPIAEAFQARGGKKSEAEMPAETPEVVVAEELTGETPTSEDSPEKENDEPPDEDEDDDDDTEHDHENEEEDDEDEEDDDEDEDEEPETARQPRKVHPPYVSPGQTPRPQNTGREQRQGNSQGSQGNQSSPAPANAPANFDPLATLRQLEGFIRQQNQQLQQAKSALRRSDDDYKRNKRGGGRDRGRRSDGIWPETGPTEDSESLQRHVTQLEAINMELRQRLEDLAADGELRAQSLAPDGASPDEKTQLCQFLSLKLGKDYADFQRLLKEPDDEVFREHYRILLSNVFEILAAEGISPKPTED